MSSNGTNSSVKKPLNSFFLYRKANRDRIVKKYNLTKSHEISKMAAQCWAVESEEVRAEYQKLSHEAYTQHKIDYPDFQWPTRNAPKKKQSRKIKVAPLETLQEHKVLNSSNSQNTQSMPANQSSQSHSSIPSNQSQRPQKKGTYFFGPNSSVKLEIPTGPASPTGLALSPYANCPASPSADIIALSPYGDEICAIPQADLIALSPPPAPPLSFPPVMASTFNNNIASPVNTIASPLMNQMASPFTNAIASPTMNQIASPFTNTIASPIMNQIASPFTNTIASPTNNMNYISTTPMLSPIHTYPMFSPLLDGSEYNPQSTNQMGGNMADHSLDFLLQSTSESSKSKTITDFVNDSSVDILSTSSQQKLDQLYQDVFSSTPSNKQPTVNTTPAVPEPCSKKRALEQLYDDLFTGMPVTESKEPPRRQSIATWETRPQYSQPQVRRLSEAFMSSGQHL
ncbi:hypothetical protein BC833DRAFT_571139 [Globomyces pollinis-pini]|nr:hypothetical protein BC833DRAFT_571139 [Globomyces pollinis-pini]